MVRTNLIPSPYSVYDQDKGFVLYVTSYTYEIMNTIMSFMKNIVYPRQHFAFPRCDNLDLKNKPLDLAQIRTLAQLIIINLSELQREENNNPDYTYDDLLGDMIIDIHDGMLNRFPKAETIEEERLFESFLLDNEISIKHALRSYVKNILLENINNSDQILQDIIDLILEYCEKFKKTNVV